MRTVVIAGGTRGIGRALASSLDGDVIALGSADADLTSVAQTRALIERLPDRIDALVLSAGQFSRRRIVTAEGHERTFAIGVLARYLLADGLRPALERSPNPMILNLCGVAGIRAGRVHWDDLTLTRGYSLLTATMQVARANDLLGAGFADHAPGSPIRYVLYNPLFVDSGMHRHFDQPVRTLVGGAAKVFGQSVERAAVPLKALLDDPPTAPLTALRRGRTVPLPDKSDAARLYDVIRAARE
ncbi:short-chain dehydrogenase [Actinoplanes sp. CA-252034]|uniref:short-chain dehydrogenase n=1 Tax=Actinoplanes sp. CA-252034 TaxID=3239906 RepID=UPI003D969532